MITFVEQGQYMLVLIRYNRLCIFNVIDKSNIIQIVEETNLNSDEIKIRSCVLQLPNFTCMHAHVSELHIFIKCPDKKNNYNNNNNN